MADCWQIVRGSETLRDPISGRVFPGNFILHAVFQIPASWIEAGVSFTVGDITIKHNGVATPIRYGAQITETFQIGIFVWAMPAAAPEPPQACVVDLKPPQVEPIQLMYEEIWDAYYGTPVDNPSRVPMTLASNSVIVPARIRQGATGNYSRYSSLHPYTSRIARAGFVAMLANTAGPPAVAPYGGVEPITGTNPICFSFPQTSGHEQVFDFATSQIVWGAVRQAAIEGKALPANSFFDATGHITTTPAEVNAVRAFGGPKGWALNLAIEILAGIMAGGKVGTECKSEFDCGAIFLALDPAATGSGGSQFAQSLDQLLTSIRASRPVCSNTPVRAPGDRGRSGVSLNANADERLELAGQLIEMMQRMSQGENVTDLAGSQLFN